MQTDERSKEEDRRQIDRKVIERKKGLYLTTKKVRRDEVEMLSG
jgi:hypothetical protein